MVHRTVGPSQRSADRVGAWHRAAIRQTGQGVSRAHGLEAVSGGRERDGVQLDGEQTIRATAAPLAEQLVQLAGGGAGAQLEKRLPRVLGSDHLCQVAADKRQAVTVAQLA